MGPGHHHKPLRGATRIESSLRLLGGIILGVAAWLLPHGVRADAALFVWADAQAHVHVTDRLGDVPEPYHSVYAARLAEMKKGTGHDGTGNVSVTPAPDAASAWGSTGSKAELAERVARLAPEATAEAQKRTDWQNRIAQARAELAAATEQLAALETTISETGMNPILRLTPQVQAQLAALETEHAQARDRVLDSRRMLLETLPQQAQREHVPPQWLR